MTVLICPHCNQEAIRRPKAFEPLARRAIGHVIPCDQCKLPLVLKVHIETTWTVEKY